MPDIWFPNLGIKINSLNRVAFSIGNIDVMWYGVVIMIGFICGLFLCRAIAKRSGQNPENYIDFFIIAVICAIVGARVYHVIFSWDYYKGDWKAIFNIKQGGLALYGGIIACVIAGLIFCKVKKIKFTVLLDTCMPALALGQAIGRWGNFFNQEAYGCYTDNLFAMRINVKTAYYIDPEAFAKAVTIDGTTYLQVHPTFFYECCGTFLLTILLLLVWKLKNKKKNPCLDGIVCAGYMIGYGIIRTLINPIRTDKLYLWNTNIAVSTLVSIIMAAGGIIMALIISLIAKKHRDDNKTELDEQTA